MGRIGKLIVAAALLVIVGSIFAPSVYLIGLAGRGRMVDRELAAIKAKGEPVSAADVAGEPVPDRENAALVYEKAFEKLPRNPMSAGGGYVWRGFLRPDAKQVNPQVWSDARRMVNRYAAALTLAEKAAAMSRCRFSVHTDPNARGILRHLPRLRQLVRLAAARAVLNAKDGDADAAVRDIELAYRIGASVRDEKTIASQRVLASCITSASDALARCAVLVSISEEQARALSGVVDSLDLRDSVRNGLLGERAMGISVYSGIWRGKMPFMDDGAGTARAFRKLGTSLPGRTWLYSDELLFLDRMDRCLKAADTPYRLMQARHPAASPPAPRYALFSTLLVPSLEGAIWTADRAKANLAGSQLLLGLIVYRDRFGSYPATLEALRASLNWKLPEDPFTGKQFVYRRQGKGFLLYSIGDDLRDNGGVEGQRMRSGDIVWSVDS